MKLEFFMPMIPPTATHQEKKLGVRNGKPYTYDPPNVRDAREKLTAHLARFAPEKPLDGALRLVVKWLFPKGEHHKDGEYKPTRPDTDNLIKLLKDCMTGLRFWRDDAQVASEINEKFYADTTGIYIRLSEAKDSLDIPETREKAFWQDEDDEYVCCSRCYSVFTPDECEDFLYCPMCGRILVR